MKSSIISVIFLFFCNFVYACEVTCEYQPYQSCNGYKLKKECEGTNIDISYVLALQCALPYLNDTAKKEYYEKIKCLEKDSEKQKVICGGAYTDKNEITWDWQCPDEIPCLAKDCCYKPRRCKDCWAADPLEEPPEKEKCK